MGTLMRLEAIRDYGGRCNGEAVPPPDVRKMCVPEHMAESIASWYRASGWKVQLKGLDPEAAQPQAG